MEVKRTRNRNQTIILAILSVLLFLTFIPIFYLVFLALKDNGQIYGRFWAMPNPIRWENFTLGLKVITRPILNSVYASSTATLGNIVFAGLSGYAFARHNFPGKEIIYTAILMLLMIPPILMLIPEFVLMGSLGLLNTLWAVIFPWMAGGQVFSLLLFRTFFASLPEDYFDAARIDGASELRVFWHIAVPLSKPIIITVAIIRLVTTYNQFMRPLIMISDPNKQVVAFTSDIGTTDLGPQMAAYIVAAIPLIIFFSFGMRYYISGLTSGGIRA